VTARPTGLLLVQRACSHLEVELVPISSARCGADSGADGHRDTKRDEQRRLKVRLLTERLRREKEVSAALSVRVRSWQREHSEKAFEAVRRESSASVRAPTGTGGEKHRMSQFDP